MTFVALNLFHHLYHLAAVRIFLSDTNGYRRAGSRMAKVAMLIATNSGHETRACVRDRDIEE